MVQLRALGTKIEDLVGHKQETSWIYSGDELR